MKKNDKKLQFIVLSNFSNPRQFIFLSKNKMMEIIKEKLIIVDRIDKNIKFKNSIMLFY